MPRLTRTVTLPSVFLSHSSVDKPFVRQLADELRRDGLAEVWLDEAEIAPGDNIVRKIEQGLGADFVLFVLSPDSVGSNWVREEWTDAFWEQTNQGRVKLIGVLYRDCRIPRLIRNKKYFDLRTDQPEGFRKIREWLRTQQPVAPPNINLLPTRPPIFVGRENDLGFLRERVKPGTVLGISGMPGGGKTTLALEFAQRYQDQYEGVYWLACESGSLPSIAADLTRQLGLSLTGDIAQIVSELKSICARKRGLLILDNVGTEEPGALIPGGAAAVLVTTRQPGLRFLRPYAGLRLDLFSEEQCFELFRRILGAAQVDAHQAECRNLFERLEYLPLAIDISANLIKYDVRHTIASLAAHPPEDVTALIKEAIAPLPVDAQNLLAAMSACAPEGFRLSLAARLVELQETASLEALYVLSARSLVDELSRDRRRYRLHALVRAVAEGTKFAEAHARAVHEQFENWENDWKTCEEDLADFRVALDWALASDASFREWLGYYGYSVAQRTGNLAQAFEICQRLGGAAEARSDKDAQQRWYGNQALILQDWDRLEEAFALHKNEEALCLELGDKDGLQRTYGNQALILQDWGRLEEALALHKKQEALCLELGNKDGLQGSYGNQALILKHWGQLEEAFVLHKREEALCLELGNKAGLAGSYWSQGLLARLQVDSETEHEKLSAALDIFTDLKMPRERDAVAKELEKSVAAGQN